MLKEVIVVPWGECPLDILEKLQGHAENAWIFLHVDAVRVLELTSTSCDMGDPETPETLKWDENNPLHPETTLVLKRDSEIWWRVLEINASNIEFETESPDPENIFFMKMDMP